MGLIPTDEDARLAEVWLEHFGRPMPIYGMPAIARRILLEHGVDAAKTFADGKGKSQVNRQDIASKP